MNKYFESRTLLNNLIDHYHKYKSIVVAFDFDNTIRRYDDGEPIREVIDLLRELVAKGYAKIFCYTSRGIDEHEFLRGFFDAQGLGYHTAINENVIEVPWNTEKAKLYYNIFLDDKCGLGQAFDILSLYKDILDKETEQHVG